jgi:hypothetical protein
LVSAHFQIIPDKTPQSFAEQSGQVLLEGG